MYGAITAPVVGIKGLADVKRIDVIVIFKAIALSLSERDGYEGFNRRCALV